LLSPNFNNKSYLKCDFPWIKFCCAALTKISASGEGMTVFGCFGIRHMGKIEMCAMLTATVTASIQEIGMLKYLIIMNGTNKEFCFACTIQKSLIIVLHPIISLLNLIID